MRTLTAATFLLRRIRTEAGAIALIWLVVGITAFLFSGAPRVYGLVADAALRHELADASAVRRGIGLTTTSSLGGADRPATALDRASRRHLADLPESVQSLVGDTVSVASSPQFAVHEPPRIPTFLVFRSQSDVGDGLTIVDGRLPAASGEPIGVQEPDADGALPGPRPRIEIALSVEAAEAVGVAVGDSLVVAADQEDELVPDRLSRPIEAEAVIVGTYVVADPQADAWFGDDSLRRARIGGTAERPVAFATGLVASDALADIAASGLPFRMEWRYLVEPARAEADAVEALSHDLRRMATEYASPALGARNPGALVLRTGLLPLVEGYRARRAASEAVLSIAVVGPLALAIGAIAMLALLLAARRRPALQLTRDRGATGRVILGAQTLEAVIVAGTAAAAGYLVAITLIPGRPSSASVALAGLVWLAATLMLVLPTIRVVRRPLVARDQSPSIRTSPRRMVLELTAVGLAVAGVLLLQRRGLTIDDSGVARFDPFLAAVPLLVGFAAAVILIRTYPYPVRALASLAARRRDLVPVLGLRTIGRRPSGGALPLLILMVATAFGAFSATIMNSLERGQIVASWMAVGADYRIDTNVRGIGDLQALSLPGVESAAPAFVDPDAVFEGRPGVGRTILLHAIAPAAYADMLAATPIRDAWTAPPQRADGAGPDSGPIPAILSRRLPPGTGAIGLGATFPVLVGGTSVPVEVVEVRDTFPGIPPGTPFLVTSLDALSAAADVEANTVFLRGSDASATAVAQRAATLPVPPVVTSRYAQLAELRGSPLIGAVGDGFRLAVLVAAAYAAVAVLGALTLSAARRTQDLTYLRTLGLSGRQAIGVTIVEHGIPVLLALVPGVVAGVIVASLLEASLGLGAFVGPGAPFRIDVDWASITAGVAALAAGLALLIAASALIARRAHGVDALRVGEA